VPRRRVRKTPRKDTGPFEDLLEQCQRAVGRVLAELPARDREVLEEHRARVVEVTHRETRAALEEIQGVLERVA
jgi:hypothetical protein